MVETNPDSGFVRKLKELDPKLGCKFNHDTRRFVITYERPIGPPVAIWTVKREDGSFRQPDDRDIKTLHLADRKHVDVNMQMEKTAKYMEQVRAKQRKAGKENIKDWTKDDKYWLRKQFSKIGGAAGKGTSPFRPITPKVKGKVFG